jgi:8-oxo-dGTP pyrophosphatase MutT (NUDIX family)
VAEHADGPTGDRPTVHREAARVLLLDGSSRVLLFHGCDPARPQDGTWWFTPGGGAEGDETPEQTARRELWEETGLRVEGLEGPVAERTTEFGFDGVAYRQHEHYFVARLHDPDVVTRPAAHTELETRAVLGWRWWSDAELTGTVDVVHPGWLGAWLSSEVHGRGR